MKSSVLYVWLQLALGICNRLARDLFSKFDSIDDIYNCEDFGFLGEKRDKYINRLENKDTSEAYEIIKRCKALGASVIGYYDESYPASLRNIESPPVALYAIGNVRDLNSIPCVGIVGTRKMSDYGKEITERFAYNFAKSGVCVVSGLAKGVDTSAHRGAVMAQGYTVAVLGNPIGDIYPRENEKAFETLYKCGLVISEMYPGCPRTRGDFPNRNRIISGICDAIVVTEAGEHSGALITARHAINQGKLLFAVPGDIGAENAGTNSLIKTGVAIATEPYDILAPLLLEYPEAIHPYEPALTEKLRSYGNVISHEPGHRGRNSNPVRHTERKPEPETNASPPEILPEPIPPKTPDSVSEAILAELSKGKALSADELCAKTHFGISEIMAELTILEICGSVSASIGGRFTKI